MAVSRKTKIFEINDKKYRFDKDSFNFLFNKYCQINKIKKEEFEFELSEQLNISQNYLTMKKKKNHQQELEAEAFRD